MNNDWMVKWDPDEDDAVAFNKLASTLMRLGIIPYFDMYLSISDNGGCSDPQCCSASYERCEIEVKYGKDRKYVEYEIYDRDY